MDKSEKIGQLAKAAVATLKEVGHPIKNKKNPHFKNTYADLLAVCDVGREDRLKNGLWLAQVPDGQGITTMLIHESGEYLAFTAEMPKEPQKFGSGFTYMRRYSQQGVMDIVAEEDDDAEVTRPDNKENW